MIFQLLWMNTWKISLFGLCVVTITGVSTPGFSMGIPSILVVHNHLDAMVYEIIILGTDGIGHKALFYGRAYGRLNNNDDTGVCLKVFHTKKDKPSVSMFTVVSKTLLNSSPLDSRI